MSVQTLDTSFPVYHNHSDIAQNNDDPLIKYDIRPLTLLEIAGCFYTAIPEIPQSVLDQYVPWKPDEPDELSSRPKIALIQPIYFSGSEPEIREPTPASHLKPDYPLTDLPDLLSKPQYLQPCTVVNPLNLNQTTSDNQTAQTTEIVDYHSSKIERKRKRQRESMRKLRKDPAYVQRERERQRERYQNDPDFAERERARKRKRQRERYHNDPDFAQRARKRLHKLRSDPAYVERERARNRERQRQRYRNDPVYAQRQRERQKQRYLNDPDFVERERKCRAEYRSKHDKDPAVQNGWAVYV
ncbi:hypothetical protein J7438_19795 [Thalassotalea sp. G20_0]|uniref:hypothetical protein n=1 Tax=Thalassotalea sp. G20_0 TaxID=2821093 RepID=UPI001ADB28D4|nr:hypothetical protein [Thalassotalea sp. G20_0]MBO9496302.1 hypothetical protein [Thalassotalea sp. G20_0]